MKQGLGAIAFRDATDAEVERHACSQREFARPTARRGACIPDHVPSAIPRF